MKYQEIPFAIELAGGSMVGITAVPEQPGQRAVLIVVGGPQVRTGSHRQFTLLARALAEAGIASLRFDYRGMGDGQGDARDFEQAGEDIGCAVDRLLADLPAVREVVLWGLCDAATACALYAPGDARVRGLVLLNPWVRTEAGLAEARVKHYYRARLFDPAMWKKLASGRLNVMRSLGQLAANVLAMRGQRAAASQDQPGLPQRMCAALAAFQGRILVLLSGDDLTAREFISVAALPAWSEALAPARTTQLTLAEADHTFSRRAWRDTVARWTTEWIAQ